MCLHHAKPTRNTIHRPGHSEWEPNVVYGHGRRRAKFHTSGTEVLHLAVAIVGLSIIFSLFFMRSQFGIGDHDTITIVAVAALVSGTGFLLHELAHKFVAQAYGHWAEFRAQWWGLAIPIAINLFIPFVAAAPGAVVISGWVRKNENGIISAAGPLTNVVIGAAAYPFTLGIGTVGTLRHDIAEVVLLINAILAIFNLIPLGPLDGKKVLAWNPAAYILLVAAALGMLLLATGNYTPFT